MLLPQILTAVPLALAAIPAPQSQPHRAPLTNTFITGVESVIDDATAIDITAPDASFNPLMDQLKAAAANLKHMAADEITQDAADNAVDAANDLVFALSACHIQANYRSDTTKCQAAVLDARTRAMQSINRHKVNGAWAEGPPTP